MVLASQDVVATSLLTSGYESGRRDLNPRPQRPERCALTKLRYFPDSEIVSDTGATRTGWGLYDSSKYV